MTLLLLLTLATQIQTHLSEQLLSSATPAQVLEIHAQIKEVTELYLGCQIQLKDTEAAPSACLKLTQRSSTLNIPLEEKLMEDLNHILYSRNITAEIRNYRSARHTD